MPQTTENSKTGRRYADKDQLSMLTADQAHELAGGTAVISRASWYAALGRRDIPSVRVGRRFLIPRHAFMEWIQGNRYETQSGDPIKIQAQLGSERSNK
jgi:excisionase family DNA binding protein